MGLAFYSTMMDARCEGIEDAADLHAGHLLFHTNRKKGESHSKSFFFFYSNWVSFFLSLQNRQTMSQPLFNYCGKRHLRNTFFCGSLWILIRTDVSSFFISCNELFTTDFFFFES